MPFTFSQNASSTALAGRSIPVVTPAPRSRLTVHQRRNGRRGSHISKLDIQKRAINATHVFMGPDFWDYKKGAGLRYNKRSELMDKVCEESCYTVTYSTLMRWIDYYQKFGEVPAQSNREKKCKTIGGLRATGCRTFTPSDLQKLKNIIDNQPQFYLDEIQLEMEIETGKYWDTSTIWRKIHTLGYSLKVAVFRAKQQDQLEVDAYDCRMLERVNHPSMVLFLDESARGANASRRRRAFSPRGVTPIVEAPMVREFDKRYTLIGACNWEGFIVPACAIVEREHGSDDTKS